MGRDSIKEEQLLLAEIQVLLAEFRTHLSLVRTGIGMVAGAVSVGFLILANSIYIADEFLVYSPIIYFILLIIGTVGLAIFLRSEKKILEIRKIIKESEMKNKRIDRIMV